MAETCGACLTLDTKYDCGWCMPEGGAPWCSYSKDCQHGEWLNNSQICPNPTITHVSLLFWRNVVNVIAADDGAAGGCVLAWLLCDIVSHPTR